MASARVALAPPRLKVEHAAVDATKPFVARGVAFSFSSHSQFLSAVVALRIERSAARLSDACERPALDYRSIKSGASESNRELPAPKAGVLPSAPPPDDVQRPVGDSNPPSAA